jgi:hypothetical protein
LVELERGKRLVEEGFEESGDAGGVHISLLLIKWGNPVRVR